MLSTIRASATFTEELDNMLFLSIYSEKEEYEKRAKEIRSRLPVPYGSIPKRKCCSTARRRKSQQQQPQQTDTLDAKKNDAVNSNTKSPCPATDIVSSPLRLLRKSWREKGKHRFQSGREASGWWIGGTFDKGHFLSTFGFLRQDWWFLFDSWRSISLFVTEIAQCFSFSSKPPRPRQWQQQWNPHY